MRTTRGSGSQRGHKGDIKGDGFLIESKATSHKSLGVKLEWLRKIAKEALAQNSVPALAVQFVDSEGEAVHMGSWIMVPETSFREFSA